MRPWARVGQQRVNGINSRARPASAGALPGGTPVHIPVDHLREFVVSGFASPLDPWTSEATQQFALARRTAARMAAEYSDAGFAVVIDDVIWRESAEQHFPDLRGRPLRKVALLPALEVALARNRTRVGKSLDTCLLEPVIRDLHRRFAQSCRPEDGWTVLDTSEMTVEATCAELFRQFAQAP